MMATIVLDPGHGGTAIVGGSSPNNARGPSGLLEKTVTLQVALRAETILASAGHHVVLTRRSDVNVGLRDRAAAAKSIAAPVFVSIHLNGFNNSTQGTETICDNDHLASSADLCRAVQKHLVAATGHRDRNASHPQGVKRQSLGVLKRGIHHARTACCLAEISFMDVAAEEARLKTAAYLDKIASSLAAGIEDYLDVAGVESASAGRQAFGDGFEAEGSVAEALDTPESSGPEIPEGLRDLPDDPARMNDAGEFARVSVGQGFASGVTDESLDMPESGGFPMADFRNFVASLGLRHISADELLFMGNSNAPGGSCAGRNSFPPPTLWNNIGNTARMLDEIRHRLGVRVFVNSGYRSASYNSCVGGESASLHMRFNAVDFRAESGTAAKWHSVARAVRASDLRFKGGIGKYNTFVHIDTRGTNADW
jgi:N-acetylmuramoyl-L-alanine amidase